MPGKKISRLGGLVTSTVLLCLMPFRQFARCSFHDFTRQFQGIFFSSSRISFFIIGRISFIFDMLLTTCRMCFSPAGPTHSLKPASSSSCAVHFARGLLSTGLAANCSCTTRSSPTLLHLRESELSTCKES